MKTYKIPIFYTLCFILPFSFTFAQNDNTNATIENSSPPFCKPLLDENQHVLIPSSGLVILYFYSPSHANSLIMGNLIENLKFEPPNNITCFKVNLSLALGLKKTYQILYAPSFIILQDKKVIYSATGFVDDIVFLQALFDRRLKNTLPIE